MRLLSMFLLLLPLLLLPQIRPQSIASRSLDVILQDYAYRAFLNPRTGTVYDGEVPFNLTGIKIAALRLRSGSLFSRGVSSYKEFEIPTGVYEQPYVERLALVYHNLANWSSTYYSLSEYTYLTPVLGLLAYDAANLSAKNLPELNISASDKPISIRFNQVNTVPDGATVKCVRFDLDGLPHFTNLTARNVCSTTQQGHFSIVVEGIVPSSAPVLPPPTAKGPPTIRGGDKDNNKSKVWIIVGAVVGGVALLVLLSLLLCCLRRYKHTNKMQQMEKAAQVGEALHMTSVGDTRAPVAMGTRTQPVLENEYVP